MKITELETPESLTPLECYRWIERVETHPGTVGIHVDVSSATPISEIYNGHFYMRAGLYWPSCSGGLLRQLVDPEDLSVKALCQSLVFETLTRYVCLCGWAQPVSLTEDTALLKGQFSPELFRARNPWAFGQAE